MVARLHMFLLLGVILLLPYEVHAEDYSDVGISVLTEVGLFAESFATRMYTGMSATVRPFLHLGVVFWLIALAVSIVRRKVDLHNVMFQLFAIGVSGVLLQNSDLFLQLAYQPAMTLMVYLPTKVMQVAIGSNEASIQALFKVMNGIVNKMLLVGMGGFEEISLLSSSMADVKNLVCSFFLTLIYGLLLGVLIMRFILATTQVTFALSFLPFGIACAPFAPTRKYLFNLLNIILHSIFIPVVAAYFFAETLAILQKTSADASALIKSGETMMPTGFWFKSMLVGGISTALIYHAPRVADAVLSGSFMTDVGNHAVMMGGAAMAWSKAAATKGGAAAMAHASRLGGRQHRALTSSVSEGKSNVEY